jgi:hypothetical protein
MLTKVVGTSTRTLEPGEVILSNIEKKIDGILSILLEDASSDRYNDLRSLVPVRTDDTEVLDQDFNRRPLDTERYSGDHLRDANARTENHDLLQDGVVEGQPYVNNMLLHPEEVRTSTPENTEPPLI